MANNEKLYRTLGQQVTDFADEAVKILGKEFYKHIYEIGERYWIEATLVDDQSFLYEDIVNDIEALPNFVKDSEKAIEVADLFFNMVNEPVLG